MFSQSEVSILLLNPEQETNELMERYFPNDILDEKLKTKQAVNYDGQQINFYFWNAFHVRDSFLKYTFMAKDTIVTLFSLSNYPDLYQQEKLMKKLKVKYHNLYKKIDQILLFFIFIQEEEYLTNSQKMANHEKQMNIVSSERRHSKFSHSILKEDPMNIRVVCNRKGQKEMLNFIKKETMKNKRHQQKRRYRKLEKDKGCCTY